MKVTTGAPIYLVSACTSGEEFVSAFRRYADRNGVVFVPIAEPLPPGRRGRFALTLIDGGVMVEGEAEIVSAAKTPSVLYGRVGMTVKFLEPDEPSKTILGELERARLALKPPPPSVAPRPAQVPAEPRPRPPAPMGRIDAVNALAECVVIGDLGSLRRDSEMAPRAGVPGYVVPSLPGSGQVIARPKTPSVPPIPAVTSPRPSLPERAKATSVPPPIPGLTKAITPTTLGMPPIGKPPSPPNSPAITSLGMPATVPPAPPNLPAQQVVAPTKSMREDPTSPSPIRAAAATHREDPTAPAMPRDKVDLDQTMRGPAPGVDLTAKPKFDMNETMRGTKPAAPAVARTGTLQMPPMSQMAAGPASPIAPAVAKPAMPEIDEATDLTSIPGLVIPEGEEQGERRTETGVAVAPAGVTVLPAAQAVDEERDTSAMAAEEATNQIELPLRPIGDVDELGATMLPQPKLPASVLNPTVEESTPSGDWTMTPGENGPTIAPRVPDKVPEKKEIPNGPPTGDWIVALDPSQPDGWSEPSKVKRSPMADQPGPPVSMVSSDKPLDSNSRQVPVVMPDNEPKVQIDPTLIEPLQPLQAVDSFDDDDSGLPPPQSASHPAMPESPMTTMPGMGPIPVTPPPRTITGPVMQLQSRQPMPQQMPGPMFGAFVTPPSGQPHLANASGPAAAIPMDPNTPGAGFAHDHMLTDAETGFFRETGDVPRFPQEETSEVDARQQRKRTIVIIASAAAAVLLGIIVLVAFGGSDEKKKSDPIEDKTTVPVGPKVPIKNAPPDLGSNDEGSAKTMVEPPKVAVETPIDAGVAVAPGDAAAPTSCEVEITSTPPGAEISIENEVKGETPTKLVLACGVETKVVLKKQRYVNMTRTITPKPEPKPVKIVLARTTLLVKVSSTPAGATITVKGKTLGITPTTVKLPAFEASTLKISKDGFALEMQKVTPKTNNVAVHTVLKRVGKGPLKPPGLTPPRKKPATAPKR